MSLLLGALTIGIILALLAIGVFISFRIYDFPDMTAEGSITLGAAVASVLLVSGVNPVIATLAALLAGSVAGATTGIIHTQFNVNGLLSGILTMTALYSVNLHIMGRSNIPLMNSFTFTDWADDLNSSLFGGVKTLMFIGHEVPVHDFSILLITFSIVVTVSLLLFIFFNTNIGTAMRATGDNAQMVRALGINDGTMKIFGLAISNGLVAVSGALLCQYQGFADVQMGIGMLVWGLASVIIGESLIGTKRLGHLLAGAIFGAVLFRLLVAVALRLGLDPNDLKLITACFVFAALILPTLIKKLKSRSIATQ